MIETEDSVEILEPPGQAEGESGAETIGFSSFGAQRINDAQKRRCRPTNLTLQWNLSTLNIAQRVMPTPVGYWGTFITTFDGKILAGARNDGLGSTDRGWATFLFLSPPNGIFSNGVGGNINVSTRTNQILGLPGSLCGFDVFLRTTQTNVNISIGLSNPYFGMASEIYPIVLNKVPQIGSFYMTAQPPTTPPFMTIRRRPEGYLANEDGAQVFLSLAYAVEPRPAGFIDPALVGVASDITPPRILTEITP